MQINKGMWFEYKYDRACVVGFCKSKNEYVVDLYMDKDNHPFDRITLTEEEIVSCINDYEPDYDSNKYIDDFSDDAEALASAGFGTDEDY